MDWAVASKVGWKGARLAVFAACLCGARAAIARDDGGGVLGVRFGGDAARTRVVVDLDRAAAARDIGGGDGPERVVVDLAGVAPATDGRGGRHGLVESWTLESRSGGARLELRLNAPGEVRRRFLIPPSDGVANWRYVVDVGPPDAAAPPARRHARARPILASRRREVIVIDAGHGGHDPGAEGGGAMEKDVTLAAARVLAARLEREGRYRVVMTRSADVFVPLAERVRIARAAGADLFISLHADSAGDDPAVHGASLYTLSDSGGTRVNYVLGPHEWFARGAKGDPAVSEILLDLTQRSTRNRSAVFAGLLLDRIADRVDLLPRSRRDAGYFVLLAPDVPAVLLEMGFISSPEDQERLADPARQGRLMDGVAEAIDAYFSQETRLAAR
ncbi:MAG: N-acetylmuramoyl-L-alanine amidase [Caulobacteraceae bacterium]